MIHPSTHRPLPLWRAYLLTHSHSKVPQIVAYPQLSSLEQNNQWNSPPADALVSTSNTTYSNLSGLRLTDSPRPSSSTTSGCSLQSQGQHNPPFRLKPDASKSDIDEYCTKLKRGGYRNIPCPFCGGEQDRVSGLKVFISTTKGV